MLSVPVCGRTEDLGAVNGLGSSADCLRSEKDREEDSKGGKFGVHVDW
jgi:hypothetical protein